MERTSKSRYKELNTYSVEIIDSKNKQSGNTFVYIAKVKSEELKDIDSFENQSIMTNLQSLTTRPLTINNFEDVFCLKNFKRSELTFSNDKNNCYIRYTDKSGETSAIVQINLITKKLRLEAFGSHFPTQSFISANQVYFRAKEKAVRENWSTEYGGINQFDGTVEFRYKDEEGKVIYAIITKADGNVDTIVEYEYKDGKKSKMTRTNSFTHTKTFYNIEKNLSTSIDIDSNGNILGITSEITLS